MWLTGGGDGGGEKQSLTKTEQKTDGEFDLGVSLSSVLDKLSFKDAVGHPWRGLEIRT